MARTKESCGQEHVINEGGAQANSKKLERAKDMRHAADIKLYKLY